MMKQLTNSSTVFFFLTHVFKVVSVAVSGALFFSSDASFTLSLQLFS